MYLSDFDYTLPPELIAQFPPAIRGESRLLQVQNGQYIDRFFSALPALLNPGDLLILNNTQVIKARLYGRKMSGGKIEVLIERITGDKTALAHIRASKAPQPGSSLIFAEHWHVKVTARVGKLFALTLEAAGSIIEMLEAIGQLPLPPYITHTPSDEDALRYQTVYAQEYGAVAAPTAGLHFTAPLFEALAAKQINCAFLTLHVGAGTFQPVRVEEITQHKMHHERYDIPQATQEKILATQRRGGKIVAVGTTSLRALEASSQQEMLAQPQGDTDIFITPGYTFKVVDALITNFHLPKSTLLMLVAAFAGYEEIMAAYHHAITQRYRFFSYGDAMMLTRSK
jgi:S-adenosylmethionine:tRNA ribosyltransferase-isomerase